MAENEGTTETGEEAQTNEEVETPEKAGTPTESPEVTTLKSRNSGLDAKVTELSRQLQVEKVAREAAAAKLSDYEAGKVGADEALRAQLELKEQELTSIRKEAQVTRVEAKYPETFALFGEDAITFSEDKLAASEARLQGVSPSTEPPTPRGNNPTGAGALPPKKEDELDDILARMASQLAATPDPWDLS